jgi:N-acetylglutamate synthase-like GNAT family acetyltransferase
MPIVTIRHAVKADAGALGDVYRRSSLSNEGDRAALLSHPEALEFSDLAVKEHRVRVAVVDDRIVGFATLLPTEQTGELEDLFVDPDWMLHGIGRTLVLDAIETAQEQGLTRIEVTANPHAFDFYEKVGFVTNGMTETPFGPGHRMYIPVPAGRS